MKITKETLKQIIKEEIKNLKEYSPYGKGARPDKRPRKPGERYGPGDRPDKRQPKPGESPPYRSDAKPDDPKRSRPPKRESVEGIDPDEPDERTHGEGFADDNG